MFRCAPDHEHRPLFNWFHSIVGTSAHIVGGNNLIASHLYNILYDRKKFCSHILVRRWRHRHRPKTHWFFAL